MTDDGTDDSNRLTIDEATKDALWERFAVEGGLTLEQAREASRKADARRAARPAEIVDKIIKVLLNRGGFDHWWHEIEHGDQVEIKVELARVIDNEYSLKNGES